MDIGGKIKNLRLKKGQLQREFGKNLGVNQQTVSAWENGLIDLPFDTLKRIAEYCNVSMNYFSGEMEEDQKYNVSKTIDDLLAKGIIKDPDNIPELAVKIILDSVRTYIRFKQLNQEV